MENPSDRKLAEFEKWWAEVNEEEERYPELKIMPRMAWLAALATQAEREKAAVAAALEEAAKHSPMLAIDEGTRKVWVYCSCGFNQDANTYEIDPRKWTEHIHALIGPDRQLALDRIIAETREKVLGPIRPTVEEMKLAAKVLDSGILDKLISELESAIQESNNAAK